MKPALRRIVVGIDGSENSRRALEWAILLTEGFDAELLAVHALGLLTHVGDGPPIPSHNHRQEVQEVFERDWCAALAGSGVARRTLCLEGPPVPALLGVSESEQADLLVVGSRGVGGFAELRLGSTSHQLVEQSRRPVLVVPSAYMP